MTEMVNKVEPETREQALTMVRAGGRDLAYVPFHLVDEEIVLAAVTNDGTAIQWAPDDLLTRDVCIAAALQNKHVIKMIPALYAEKQVWEDLVTKDPTILHLMPSKAKTLEVCLLAIAGDPEVIGSVPVNVLQEGFVKAAAERAGEWTLETERSRER